MAGNRYTKQVHDPKTQLGIKATWPIATGYGLGTNTSRSFMLLRWQALREISGPLVCVLPVKSLMQAVHSFPVLF